MKETGPKEECLKSSSRVSSLGSSSNADELENRTTNRPPELVIGGRSSSCNSSTKTKLPARKRIAQCGLKAS